MKYIKYPYGLFISAIIIFILGMIHDELFFPEYVPIHVPMVFYASFYSFKLLLIGLIHLGIYKEASNNLNTGKFSNETIKTLSKLVYKFTIVLVFAIVIWFTLKYLTIYFYSIDGNIFKILLLLSVVSNLILLFIWLWI